MSKVITDEKLVEEFLNRGVEAIYPTKEALKEKLMSGERIRVYQGFDPTGPYLHIGHAMGIRGMRILQKLGHEVIFLVGDFTSRVGDPDKDSVRKLLSVEEIEKNMSGWKEQASQMIDFEGENPVLFKHNFDWLSKLKLEDLIELMSHMTVQRMMERDMFERRYKQGDPIYIQEFIYPLMQGYDGVAMEVDMEIGGTDQTFNMLVGRDLSKAYLKKEKFVRTNKMMDAPDAITMSKTKGNGINLGDSAEDMYGKAMSYSDEYIFTGMELATDIPMGEIEKMKKAVESGENPMQFKKKMAYEIVKVIKGQEAAQKGRDYFEKVISKKETPDELEELKVKEGESLAEMLEKEGLAASRGEAKRKMSQGGVKLDDQPVIDVSVKIALEMDKKVLKVGKKDFRQIVIDK